VGTASIGANPDASCIGPAYELIMMLEPPVCSFAALQRSHQVTFEGKVRAREPNFIA